MFPHKNALGMKMAFGILLLFFTRPAGDTPRGFGTQRSRVRRSCFSFRDQLLHSWPRRFAWWPSLFLHVARIKTKRTLPLWVPLLPFFICLALVVVTGSALILEAVGRTTTLTGRTPLWAAVVDAISLRPWLGYGYAIFWVGGNLDSLNVIKIAPVGTHRTHTTGTSTLRWIWDLFGLAVFLFAVGVALSRALKLFQEATTREEKWPLVLCCYFSLRIT